VIVVGADELFEMLKLLKLIPVDEVVIAKPDDAPLVFNVVLPPIVTVPLHIVVPAVYVSELFIVSVVIVTVPGVLIVIGNVHTPPFKVPVPFITIAVVPPNPDDPDTLLCAYIVEPFIDILPMRDNALITQIGDVSVAPVVDIALKLIPVDDVVVALEEVLPFTLTVVPVKVIVPLHIVVPAVYVKVVTFIDIVVIVIVPEVLIIIGDDQAPPLRVPVPIIFKLVNAPVLPFPVTLPNAYIKPAMKPAPAKFPIKVNCTTEHRVLVTFIAPAEKYIVLKLMPVDEVVVALDDELPLGFNVPLVIVNVDPVVTTVPAVYVNVPVLKVTVVPNVKVPTVLIVTSFLTVPTPLG